MPERFFKIGFLTKAIIVAMAIIISFGSYSFGRNGVKLFSIGNNLAWNNSTTWSLSSNGTSAGLIPQSNDTVIIECSVIQNINVTFSGSGLLIISNTGLLRGDNLDLVFSTNSALKCYGELRTSNLSFSDNASFLLESNGKILVKNTLINNSLNNQVVSGKLSVTGSISVGSSASISGNGAIESIHYYGSGSVFGINPPSVIPDGSIVSENNWIGAINNNWNEPLNWSGGTIPDGTSNISILTSDNNPQIQGVVLCNHLYINSNTILTVYPTAVITITGNLSVLGVGKLLLKNTNIEKSSLILYGDISGKLQVEYPVVKGQNNLVSSPLASVISGTFINMYLRSYDESSSQWGEYIVPTTEPLEMMRGYELFSLFSETRIIEGTINHEQKSFPISNSGNGLNLTGNPFPCYIDWENNNNDAWQRSAVAAAIYYPDPSGSGNFSVYMPGGDNAVSINNGNRYIAPMQGFFVKAGEQGTLNVSENSRVSNMTDSKVELKNSAIKFHLQDNTGLSDETLFRVIENSTFGFDDELDAIKLQGTSGSPSLFLKSDDDVKYAINTIPSLNSSLEIPMDIACSSSGMFTISTTGSFNFEYRYPVTLEDKELNKFIDLRVDSVYSFYHTPEMNSSRFLIHFNSTESVGEVNDLQTTIRVLPGEINITGSEKDTYTANLFTAEGKLIASGKGILSEGINLSTANNPSSVCLIQLFNGKHTITKKIFSK
jgi:hypothetical protein